MGKKYRIDLMYKLAALFLLVSLCGCGPGYINKPQPVSLGKPVDTTDQLSDEEILEHFYALKREYAPGFVLFNDFRWEQPIYPAIVSLSKTENTNLPKLFSEGLNELGRLSGVKINKISQYDPYVSNFIVFYLSREEFKNIQNTIELSPIDPKSNKILSSNSHAIQIAVKLDLYSYSYSNYKNSKLYFDKWIRILSSIASNIHPQTKEKEQFANQDLCSYQYIYGYDDSHFLKTVLFVPRELNQRDLRRCLYSEMFRGFGLNMGYHQVPSSEFRQNNFQFISIGLVPAVKEKSLLNLGPSILNQGAGYDYYTKQDRIFIKLYYHSKIKGISTYERLKKINPISLVRKIRASMN